MNVRDTLIEWGLSAREADEVLWDHAHELAEKIRQEIQSLRDHEVLERDKDWAASDAADLIDPEVE